MNYKKDDDLIAVRSIEMAFIKFNGMLWGEVNHQLKMRHGSGFEICLDHPEYLKEILMEICGNSYLQVVKKVTPGFDRFTNERMESLIKTLLE